MKKILLSFLFAVISCVSAVAQQTPYERKVQEICYKYYSLGTYGYEKGLDMSDMFALALIGEEAAARMSILNYGLKYDVERADKWFANFEKELENAKSLMTEEDFHRLFLSTSYGLVLTQVKEDFDKTFTKDPFETKAQFQARVKKDGAQTYDHLCNKMVAQMNSTLQITISPKSYDPENCVYNVTVEEIFNLVGGKEVKSSYETSIPMSPDMARQYNGEEIKPESIMSVDWITLNDVIHANKVVYSDNNLETKTFNVTFQNSELLTFKYDKYKESEPLLPGHIWKSSDLISYFEIYTNKLRSAVDEYNKKISASEYYSAERSSNSLLDISDYTLPKAEKYNEEALKQAFCKQEAKMQENYTNALKEIELDCRQNDPDRYIAIYAAKSPDFEAKFNALEFDYRCCSFNKNQIAFYIIDNIMPEESKCFDKYIKLFNSADEFYSFYNDATRFNQEVSFRQKINSKHDSILRALQYRQLVFKAAQSEKNATIMAPYLEAIEEFKIVESWYNATLEAFFKADAKMVKEFEKSGSFFKSKQEFFDAYISPDYKTILKTKK